MNALNLLLSVALMEVFAFVLLSPTMKITIAPSASPHPTHRSVTIESHDDDLTLDEAVEMAGDALRAWGFVNVESISWEPVSRKEP